MFRYLLAFLCFYSAIDAKTVHYTIFTFNDFYTVAPDNLGKGGFAGMATLLEQEREKAKHHITTVNGDFLFPSILSTYDLAAHRIELMNDLKVDLVVLGNHEFDMGVDVLKKRMSESKFLYLTANAFNLDNRPFTGAEQIYIVDVDGVKIGFFGLITVETPLLSSTENRVNFTPIAYTARQMVKQLKSAGADVIVALTHLFMGDDKKLAQEVPGIDLILGGHDHDPITWYNGDTFIHKSGQNAYFLTRINLKIDKDESTSAVHVYPSWEVIYNHNIPGDPVIEKKITALESRFDKYAQEPLGIIGTRLDSTAPGIRLREMSMGNLVADAVRYATGADIALICGGVIRGSRVYEPGEVLTLKDILGELPFKNINVVIEMTGRDLLEALENGVSQIEGTAGRFLQVSGLQYVYDLNQKSGKRICEVNIAGKALEPSWLYKVATIDYVYNGGDGYTSFKKGRLLLDPLQHQETVQSVIDYIKHLGKITYGVEERIVVYHKDSGLDERFYTESGGGIGTNSSASSDKPQDLDSMQ